MINPEQVPELAMHAAEAAWSNEATWPQIIAAALNAWPGMKACEEDDLGPACLILPLPPPPKGEQE